ncbi:fluoride efflux transporter CrcB [Cohnella lubricantis]|uniref:Fluoride-specific ion channel FluC n=1 Tax=Cohnella lubricantis TaxID=2163172 RepID=A0A841TCX4_9BACL|nr:fluoride efflux transporter CrcB [Cohnella lubricantis]MBB6677865.1 fluoride efflux transporter CrcB [Cohnella lubricantis]MBP2119045.1 CrcB protein [Cohnella lubricantis]
MKAYWPIGLFGIFGALSRYELGLWVQDWRPSSSFPAGTLIINLAGCLLLGWFANWAASKSGMPAWFRTGFGTGFVGSFTTFSTFSVETVSLMKEDQAGLAALYVASSLIGGLAFAAIGYWISQAQSRRRTRGAEPS